MMPKPNANGLYGKKLFKQFCLKMPAELISSLH